MNKKRFYTGKNQDGVALIFALAMLALLLIMLIGFLASSILEQRIAYSYRDDVGSRLLVRSALVRVKSLLKASDEYPDDLLYMRAGAPEVSGKPDIIAPIVSMTSDAERTTGEPSGNDTAYKALKPLLKKYFGPNKAETADDVADKWEWTNFFPSNVSMFYPNWIYYYSDPQATGNNRRITGRMAYVAVPNMGINLSLLEGKDRVGKEFAELSSEAFLTSSGKNTLNRFANWLSVDVLMGGDGLYRKENETSKIKFDNVDEENFHSGKLGAKIEGSTSDWGKEKAFSTLFLTTSESGFVSNGHKFDIAKFSKSGGAVKLFSPTTDFDWSGFFSTNFDFSAGSAELKQVTANAKDYVDADHLPTTDLNSDTAWEDQTPTYAGNEKTPYINQIVPAFEIKADYTVTSVRKNILQTTYTQKVTFDVKSKVFAELVNIYGGSLETEGTPTKLVLKNLKITLNRTAQIGRVVAGVMISTGTSIPDAEITLTADTVELPITSVAANSYATFNSDVTLVGNIPTLNISSDHVTALGNPTLDVSFDLTGVEFERAVLVNSSDKGLDFVGKLELDGMPKQFIGRSLTTNPDTNMPQMNTDNAWEFSSSNISKIAHAYVNFEVADPRFNLASDQWKKSEWKSAMSALDDAVPEEFNYGENGKNSNAEASNNDLAEEKDLETDNDPVKLSTAYIRNAPMQSLSELGLIHRAKPWQTFNLRSTPADPDLASTLAVDAKLSYLNDAIILERYLMKLDEPTMNVNYPANMTGALAPLTTNLKYRAYRADDAASELSADAQKELRSWLANKCYQASSNDPKSDSSEKYNRYVRRSEMVNVITDWALNGNKSPWKGKGSDAALEEIVTRIVPHVRFGEMFEYYTVFAVAQTIKDMGGTVYRNDANGKLKKFDNAKFGEMDENDIITSETFLVARLRRTISCKNEEGKYNKSCLWGRHQKGCTKTITVLESYTLNMD